MSFNKLIGVRRGGPGADKSAVATINDSVGKIGIDQLDQATSKGKRRVKQAEQAKVSPRQRNTCRETQPVCLHCT